MTVAELDPQSAEWLQHHATPPLLAHWCTGGTIRLYRHTLAIGRKFAETALKPNGRLIISIPPQRGKTMGVSVWGPIWYLDLFPQHEVLVASYGDELRQRIGREMRNAIKRHPDRLRLRLMADSQAAHRFDTPEGGGLFATTVRSELSGYPGHLIVIDDPYKDWAQAHSPLVRRQVSDWFKTVALMRSQAETSIVVATCLAPDTHVPVVGKGWCPVPEVRAGDRVYAFDGAGLVEREVLDARRSGVDEILRVRTDRLSIAVNERHPFLVIPDDGHARPAVQYEWRKAGHLEVGDIVLTAGELPTAGAAPVEGWCTPDRAWLLGFLVGDGWVTRYYSPNRYQKRDGTVSTYHPTRWSVFYSVGIDKDLNQRAHVALTEAFGGHLHWYPESRYYRMNSANAGRTLDALGLHPGVGARGKTVPGWLFDAPSEVQEAFIRGYADADGHKKAKGEGWALVSASRPLLDGVRRLASTCGVRAGDVYARKVCVAQPPNSPSPIESVSFALSVTFDAGERGRSLVTGDLPPGCRAERVRSIERGPAVDVYDLSVEGDENFVAEGFIVHNTRYHEDDLSGELAADVAGEYPWEVLRIPAVAEDDPEHPDPLGRAPGEVIEERQHPGPLVREAIRVLGSYKAASIMMQRPGPLEGGLLKKASWVYAPPPPDASLRRVARSWDLAYSESDGSDWTVGTLMTTWRQLTYVLEMIRVQVEPTALRQLLKDTARDDARRWGRKVTQLFEQEPAGGKMLAETIADDWLAGYKTHVDRPTTNKELRATNMAAAQGNREIVLCSARRPDGSFVDQDWLELVDEAAVFPAQGANDDIVDTVAHGYDWLAEAAPVKAGIRSAAGRRTPPGR